MSFGPEPMRRGCCRCGRDLAKYPPDDGLCRRCRDTLKRNPNAERRTGRRSVRACRCGLLLLYSGFGRPPSSCERCKRLRKIEDQRRRYRLYKDEILAYQRAWRRRNYLQISEQKKEYYLRVLRFRPGHAWRLDSGEYKDLVADPNAVDPVREAERALFWEIIGDLDIETASDADLNEMAATLHAAGFRPMEAL